jgi:uncharacterized protein
MHARFGLTLMVTHACNLRCAYCYTGLKKRKSMSLAIGRRAIDRAVASIDPEGTLELSFFGGEPLLEADLIGQIVEYAEQQTDPHGQNLSLSLTTNGTIVHPAAWTLMMRDDLELAISCDGRAEVHDRYRRDTRGEATFDSVIDTVRRLVAARRPFRVVMVVNPDTLAALPEGMAYLRDLSVRCIQPALNHWTAWSESDLDRLACVIAAGADQWRAWLPEMSISWFDTQPVRWRGSEGASMRAAVSVNTEIAVAPSGRLYPCERLIGEDVEDHPLALAGHVLEGHDFLGSQVAPARAHPACGECAMASDCDTDCRCSNYIRTGDVTRPDQLLCRFNQECLTQTARVLNEPVQIRLMPQFAGDC